MNHSDFTALKDDEVAACPACDAAQVSRIKGRGMNAHTGKRYTYLCYACRERFDEFVTRRRKASATSKGLANKLLRADPSEVSQ